MTLPPYCRLCGTYHPDQAGCSGAYPLPLRTPPPAKSFPWGFVVFLAASMAVAYLLGRL